MKKIICVMLVLSALFFLTGKSVLAANENPLMKDSWMDKVSDWFATRGMSKEEKDRALLERKTARIYKRTEKQIDKQAEKVQKSFQDFQKSLSNR